MIIGDRLREMREAKKLSQGDIEKRSGLFRCYISRVENGHTVPAIETLEKMARALEVPLYQLFYDGEEPPKLPNLLKRKTSDEIAWGSSGKDARFLSKLRRLLAKADVVHDPENGSSVATPKCLENQWTPLNSWPMGVADACAAADLRTPSASSSPRSRSSSI